MHRKQCGFSVILAVAALVPAARTASAQGCVLLRQTSPMFGTTGSLDSEAGTWTFTLTGRNSRADTHYIGTVEQVQRQADGTYVLNKQDAVTATIGYQLTRRISLNAGIPFVFASWGIPSPRSAGPAARANENARGSGDVTTLARVALIDPAAGRSWSVLVGGGVKLPTGNSEATDVFPDGNGQNNVARYVDISAQPGDGGWGIIVDALGFKEMGRFLAFGSGTWLANPQNTGGPTRATLAATAAPANVNTISDQFVFRSGASFSLTTQIALSIAWRMEGVPRYDLFGRSDGFRRPGVEMYWEPGVTVSAGRHTVSFNIPVGYYFNRFPNPYTGARGDSTFPSSVSLATYSVRLGRQALKSPVTDQPKSLPTPTPTPVTGDSHVQTGTARCDSRASLEVNTVLC
jgi:hypothetical protein